jgi:hypothetical protein
MGRLRRHTSPRFVRRLLEEPTLELRDVVAIAARRPTDAAILAEIAASGRWVRHLPVREALVDNPFASPGMAVKYLATLPSPFVRRVARAAELHPLLRDAARAYLDAA